jgi:hypothetical protein
MMKLIQLTPNLKIINILVLSNLSKFLATIKENLRDNKGNKETSQDVANILDEKNFFVKLSKACRKFLRKKMNGDKRELV